MSFKRWLSLAVLGAIALIGLIGGSNAATPEGQFMGVTLAFACAIAGFMVIKHHFDGLSDSQTIGIMPSKPQNALRLLVILGLMALGGLFLAADHTGPLHWSGLALSVASVILGFGALRAYFDGREKEIRSRLGKSGQGG